MGGVEPVVTVHARDFFISGAAVFSVETVAIMVVASIVACWLGMKNVAHTKKVKPKIN